MISARLATASDISELLRVINAAYRVEDFFVHGDRVNMVDLERRIGGTTGVFLVLDATDAPGQLIGAVYVELRGARGYFGMLSVDPARQREGTARKLIGAAEAYCRAGECDTLEIDVVDLRQELPAFYARFGFVMGETFPFPEPDKLRAPAKLVRWTKPL